MKGDIKSNKVTYTSPNGSVHTFYGPDCWDRAIAFKSRYKALTQ